MGQDNITFSSECHELHGVTSGTILPDPQTQLLPGQELTTHITLDNLPRGRSYVLFVYRDLPMVSVPIEVVVP